MARRFLLLGFFSLVMVVYVGTSTWHVPTSNASPAYKPTSTPSVSLMQPYTIEALRARQYPGGEIRIIETYQVFDAYTRYLVEYPSDGLRITAVLQVPNGRGPFPVVILNHGYIRRDQYWSGAGTWEAADYLSYNGYLTIAPDYRSWGGSESGLSLFHTGLVADVVNLVSSLGSLGYADTNRIVMWGHSMGGGITTKVLTIDPRIKAAVLYAPNSSDDADIIERWGAGCSREWRATERCNRADVLPTEDFQTLLDAYQTAVTSTDTLQRIAPYYYLGYVQAPVQIHIGTADSETPPAWSQKLYTGLVAADKTVEIYTYRGQGHLFQGKSWELFMQRVVEFYNAQLGIVNNEPS